MRFRVFVPAARAFLRACGAQRHSLLSRWDLAHFFLSQEEKTPYAFYVGDVEINGELAKFLVRPRAGSPFA